MTLYAALTVEDRRQARALQRRAGARPRRQAGSRAAALARARRRAALEPHRACRGDDVQRRHARGFHFEPIDYRATLIESAGGAASLPADVRPTLTPDHGGGIGTMRYQLVALQGDRVIASAGPRPAARLGRRHRRGAARLDPARRHVPRLHDRALQPALHLGVRRPHHGHPPERAARGSDCADLTIYGQRRLGKKLAYAWTGALPQVTSLIAGKHGDGSTATRSKPIPFPRIGDLMLFPRHVGALAADRGQPGILDDQDLMMHTLFDSPEQAIGGRPRPPRRGPPR